MDLTRLREAELLLSKATTPFEVKAAHQILKSAIYTKRQKIQQATGVLAETLQSALAISRKMKSDGESEQSRNDYLEKIVREVWPKRRAATWTYTCDDCRDTGLILMECTPDHRCDGIATRTNTAFEQPGRHQRLCTKDPGYVHDYGIPCHCSRGDAFKIHVKQRGHTLDDAGSSPRKKLVRIGG